ncbi:MAG: hypothetical protein ACREPU_00820 [Rhodanobacteraceae bacterium]
MKLARWPKVRRYAEIDFQVTALKPTTTTLCEVGRFFDLSNSENFAVEFAGAIFAAGRQR